MLAAHVAQTQSSRAAQRGLRLDGAIATFLLAIMVALLSEALFSPDRRIMGLDTDEPYYWAEFNRDALMAGQLPLWNPYLLSGMPALADNQTGVLYPPGLVLRALPLSTHQAMSWNIGLHLWLMALGTYALCRVVGTSRGAGLIAAIGMMLGGATAPRIFAGHIMVLYGFCWVPLVLALAVRSVDRRGMLPSAGLVGLLVVQSLAGAIQPLVYGLAAIGAYAVYSVVWPNQPRADWRTRLLPLGQVALLAVFFAGVSAFHALPTRVLMGEANRGSGLQFEQTLKGSFLPGHLVTFLHPNAKAWSGNDFQDGLGGGIWEKSPYVAVVLTLVAPLAFLHSRQRRMIVFLVILGLIALGMAMGQDLPLYRVHHALLPGFRVPGRLLALTSLTLVVLGAIGLDVVTHSRAQSSRVGTYVTRYLVGAMLMFAALGLGGVQGMDETVVQLLTRPEPPRFWGFLFTVLCLMLMAVCVRWRPGVRVIIPVALVAGLADMYAFSAQFIAIQPVRDITQARALYAPLEIGRILSLCQSSIGTNAYIDLKVSNADGSNQAVLGDYAGFTSLVLGESLPGAVTGAPNIGNRGLPKKPALLQLLNVTHIHACSDLPEPFRLVQSLDAQRVYENPDAMPRAFLVCEVDVLSSRQDIASALTNDGFDAGRKALVLDEKVADRSLQTLKAPCSEPGEVQVRLKDQIDGRFVADVRAPADGLLVLSEPYFPERHIWVNGERVTALRTNLAFTGVHLPAGSHVVEIRFVPESLYLGIGLTIATLIVWMVLAMMIRQRIGSPHTPSAASIRAASLR
ncbi:MAG: YfhO family protein [Chloroflexota bacterium]